MAFGLKGGVAPSLTDQIEDAANVVKEQVEQTTTGLFWRAKQFLRKESASSADGTPVDMEAAEEKPEPEAKPQLTLPRDAIDDLLDDEPPEEDTVKKVTPAAPATSIRHKLWTAWGKRGSSKPAVPSRMEAVAEKGVEEESENVPQPKRTPII